MSRLSIIYFEGSQVSDLADDFLSVQIVQTLMRCCIPLHLILVYTFCHYKLIQESTLIGLQEQPRKLFFLKK